MMQDVLLSPAEAELGGAQNDPIALSCRCLTSEDSTSFTYRGMDVSPVRRALLAEAAVSSPAPTCSGLRLPSRMRGLSTEHPASLLDATRRHANGLFVDSVTLLPAAPLGNVGGTQSGHSGA